MVPLKEALFSLKYIYRVRFWRVERGGLGKMLMALLFMNGLLRYFGQMKIIDV